MAKGELRIIIGKPYKSKVTDQVHTGLLFSARIDQEDVENTGLTHQDFYDRFKSIFPKSEGFVIKCEAERTETITIDLENKGSALPEPVVIEHR